MGLDRNLSGCQIFHPSELPSSWDCEPVAFHVAFEYGAGLTEAGRKSGEIPVYGSNGIVGTHDRAMVRGPGIVIGRKGTIGAICYSERDFWPIDTTYYVRRLKDDPWRFLYYLLDYLDLGKLNAATGVPGLSRRDALAIRGAFPPQEEACMIAHTLDAADAAIERTYEAIAKARRLQDGLVQQLLSSGIDANGQIRDRKANPSDFQTTKASWLPVAWQISSVGREFEIGTGFTLNESRRPRVNKVKYLRVANVQRDHVLLDDVAELEATPEEAADRLLREGDLLAVEGHADPNAIGRCARVPIAAEGMSFQNHLFRLRGKEIISDFACLWLNSLWARRYWRRMCATSSGLNTINQRMLKALLIPKPEPDEQARISQIAAKMQAEIGKREESLNCLHRLKRGLMQDLLTGSVRVNGRLSAEK